MIHNETNQGVVTRNHAKLIEPLTFAQSNGRTRRCILLGILRHGVRVQLTILKNDAVAQSHFLTTFKYNAVGFLTANKMMNPKWFGCKQTIGTHVPSTQVLKTSGWSCTVIPTMSSFTGPLWLTRAILTQLPYHVAPQRL